MNLKRVLMKSSAKYLLLYGSIYLDDNSGNHTLTCTRENTTFSVSTWSSFSLISYVTGPVKIDHVKIDHVSAIYTEFYVC